MPADLADLLDAELRATRAEHPHVTVALAAFSPTDTAHSGTDPAAVYRIASVSKTLTATALGVAVARGELDLDDPAERHLPAGFRLPTWDGEPVRVHHLATHTTGLPRGFEDPRTGHDPDALAAAIAGAELASRPGTVAAYSNLGVALLGQVLATVAGTTYAEVVSARVTAPLGLTDTTLEPTADQRNRLVGGVDTDGVAVETPTLPVGAPSGGFYSTPADLVRLLRHYLDPDRIGGELAAAARLVVVPRTTLADDIEIGLCWLRSELPHGTSAYWHNGSLPGYRSFVGYAPATGTGVVALGNCQQPDLDPMARRLLDQ